MKSSRNLSPSLDPEVLEGLRSLQDETDPHFLANYLKLFLDPIPLRFIVMETAMQTKDFVLIQSEAHALKASCGNTGALKMASICAQLEQMAKANQLTDASSKLLEELKLEFEQVKMEIKSLL